MIKPFTAYSIRLPHAYFWSVPCHNPTFICILSIKHSPLYLVLSLLSWPFAAHTCRWRKGRASLLHCNHVLKNLRLDRKREARKGVREGRLKRAQEHWGMVSSKPREQWIFRKRQWPVSESWLTVLESFIPIILDSFRIFYPYHFQDIVGGRNTT